MAAKTANVLARVEPSVKEQAQEIMEMLGIPVSVVINTLYENAGYASRGNRFSGSVPQLRPSVGRRTLTQSGHPQISSQKLPDLLLGRRGKKKGSDSFYQKLDSFSISLSR